MKEYLAGLYNFLLLYGAPFALALFLSLIFTPIVRMAAVRYKFVVYPKNDRWRKRVVASLGGVAIFGALLIPYLLFCEHSLKSTGFIFGIMGIFWLGLVDDIVTIKPDTKLIGQIIIACITVMFGIQFRVTSSGIINTPLTIFWIVGISNAFNLLDNMDGLCAGIASISALILSVNSIMNNNVQLLVLSLIILGATLGFLKYNFSPAKIFMGDCGSMLLGYALATSALMGTKVAKSGLMITMAIPALVLAVPIFDTTLVTLMRIFNGRPISQGGRDHTSHRLVTLGLSEKKAVLLLYAISAVCGLSGLLYAKLNFVHMSVLLTGLLIGLFIFGIFLGTEVKVYSLEELNNLKNKRKLNGKVVFNGFIYNKRRIVEVTLDFMLISLCYISAFVLRFEGILFSLNVPLILESLPIVLIIKFLMFYSFGLYRGAWRYIGLYDFLAIFKATVLGSVLSASALLFLFRLRAYSRTVFIIDWLLTFLAISGVRILFRLYKEFFANVRTGGKRVLIFGAGDAGELTLREIRQNVSLGYKPIGFVDDDEQKMNMIIHGVRVMGKFDNLEKLISKYKIAELLVAIPVANKKRRAEIYEICNNANIPFREVSKIIQTKKEFE